MLKKAAKWAGATILSALIGASVVWYFDKAVPSATLASVSVQNGFDEKFDDITLPIDENDETIKGLLTSQWVIAIRNPSMPLSELLEVLQKNRRKLERNAQSVDRFLRDLPNLKGILERAESSQMNAEEFFDIWERNDGYIYGSIRGDFSRGTFKLPDPTPEYSGDPLLYLDIVGQMDSGLDVYGTQKVGSKFVSYLYPDSKEQIPLNDYAAKTLRYYDKAELKKMLKAVEEDANQRHLHKILIAGVDKYLLSLSRWSAMVIVSNSGSRTMSISPKGRSVVDTKDTSIDSKDASKNKSFVEIEMEHRGDSGQLDPVNVPGGESRVIKFVANELVLDKTKWDKLHSMFKNKAKKSYFLLSYLPKSVFGGTTLYTPIETFGNRNPLDTVEKESIGKYFQ